MDGMKCLAVAGSGGAMPALVKLGSSFVTDPAPALPPSSFWLGVLIFFLVSAVLGYVLSKDKKDLQRALLTGIAAPAIVTSVVAGYQTGREKDSSSLERPRASAPAYPSTKAVPDTTIQPQIPQTTPTNPRAAPPAARGQSDSRSELRGFGWPRLALWPSAYAADAPSKADPACREGCTYLARVRVEDGGPAALSSDLSINGVDTSGRSYKWNLPAYEGAVASFQAAAPLTRLAVFAGAESRTLKLPADSTSGIVTVTLSFSRRKDLLWALGGRGGTHIENVSLSFQQAYEPKRGAVQLNGTWVCMKYCPAGGEGKAASIVQSEGVMTFRNEGGGLSTGKFVDAATVLALDWGALTGRIVDDGKTIEWANGTVWSRAK